MPLNASSIQQMILDSLRSSKGLTKEPDSFLDRLLAGHEYDAEALSRATAAVYKQAYYTFARDLDVDPTEQRKLLQLARLLRLDDEQRTKHHYEVGLAIYRKRFREASADGDLSQSEQDDLDSIATTFGLQNRHIRQAIAKDALAHYSFVLANSLKDGVLSTEEMAELELIAKRFGLDLQRVVTNLNPRQEGDSCVPPWQRSRPMKTLAKTIAITFARSATI